MQMKTLGSSLLVGALLLGLTTASLAETLKHRHDLTGREDVSVDEIITALTPVKTRGLKTRGIQPGLATVALTIHFDFDSAQLSPESLSNLQSLGRALQSPQLAPYRIQIEGHTDNIGPLSYNESLSQRRAKAVKDYLVEHFDITPDNLMTEGRGESEPIADNDTAQGRYRNRRAEFVNLGK
jgi:outer membrane protein OmpA-like peptidoglycan-associated protein